MARHLLFVGSVHEPESKMTRAPAPLAWLTLAAALATQLGCPPPDDYYEPPEPPEQTPWVGRVSVRYPVGNATDRALVVRVRALRADLSVDCGVLMADPSAALTRDHFGPATAWLLDPGAVMALPAPATAACGAVALVDGTDLPLRLWVAPSRAETSVSADAHELAPTEAFVLTEDGAGGVRVADNAWLYPAPAGDPAPLFDRCTEPGAFGGVDWSEAPPGDWRLEGTERAPDGCVAYTLGRPDDGDWRVRFYACAPTPLPFAPDDLLTFADFGEQLTISSARHEVRLVKGGPQAPVGGVLAGCGSTHDACGNFITAVRPAVLGADGETIVVTVGEPTELEPGHSITVARAERMDLVDLACRPNARAGRLYFEYVETLTRTEH